MNKALKEEIRKLEKWMGRHLDNCLFIIDNLESNVSTDFPLIKLISFSEATSFFILSFIVVNLKF